MLNLKKNLRKNLNLYINLAWASGCLIVFCLLVSNERQNGLTDRAQILCENFVAPGKVYE